MQQSARAEKRKIREQVNNSWQVLKNHNTQRLAKFAIEKIALMSQFVRAKTILVYAAQAEREIDFVSLLMQQYPQKEYAFPRVEQEMMEFFIVNNYQQLIAGKFGILSPALDAKQVLKEVDLIFVPAVACDLQGNRLGRGRGYYDKFLSDKKTIFKVCVLPEFAVLAKIPVESFDQKVDFVISIKDSV